MIYPKQTAKQTASLAIVLTIVLSGSAKAQERFMPTVPPNPNPSIDSLVFNAPPPPPTGRPGRRSDAGSRSCGEDAASTLSNLAEPKPLLSLVPIQNTASSTVVFGKTTAAYPTFWFYVPYRSVFTATFVLQDQDGNPVYESDVTLPQTAGILSLTLPETVAPLEAGKLYHWFFKLYCRSVSPPDAFVDGWIQREALPSDWSQQLQTATPQQQVRFYAANGFWFEALTTAAELRRTNPADSTWADLLSTVGLESVATEAIVTP
jgi:hypothetical protein